MQGMADLLLELPREIIALIARHLSPAQLGRVLETCSAWSRCFGSALHTLAPTGVQHLDLLKRFPYLQHLDLSKSAGRLKTDDLSQLQHLPELRRLSLQGCSSITDLHFLAGIKGTLKLPMYSFNPAGLLKHTGRRLLPRSVAGDQKLTMMQGYDTSI